jgi:hypothetical protein
MTLSYEDVRPRLVLLGDRINALEALGPPSSIRALHPELFER